MNVISANAADLSQERTDDLHLLMATAILCGQKGTDANVMPIFDCWSNVYPDDALPAIGRGLALICEGEMKEGIDLISRAAKTAQTRAEQAKDVLGSLVGDLPELAEIGGHQ